jgi:tetratricopeptide (TPR) repeat protein
MGKRLLRLLIGLLLGPILLAAMAPAAEPPGEKPPWQRLLQGDEARKAQMLEERFQALQEAGKFEEALAVAEEFTALRRRLQGADHWQAINARYQVEAVRKASRAGKEDRAAYAQSFSWQRQADALIGRGRYREALPLFEKVLAIRRKVPGEEHPDTASSCNAVGFCLYAQGLHEEAEARFRKALAICRKVLGEEHPDTAGSYNSVAANLQAQGRYQEAQEGYQKALAIWHEVLGEEHPDTATACNNVAGNLYTQGRYQEAEQGFQKALAIHRKVLGEEHPDAATNYNNVALNLQAQGRYKEAEEGFQKALAIRRKVLGEEHPDTAQSYDNVAVNLHDQGRYKEAQEGNQKALDIYRKVFGEEHPDTALGYNNVAANLQAQGRYTEAQEGYQKALAIQRKVLGEEHPATAGSFNNIAGNLNAQGRYKEAQEGYQKALDIRRVALGEEHPGTARSYNNVAANLNAQGRYREAEKMYVRGAAAFLAARLHTAASGLGRATKTSELSPLLRLAALLARNAKPTAAWQRLEQSLGRGTWDDLSARLRRPAKELARQTELVQQLDRLDQLLTRHSAIRKPTAAREREDLLERRRLAQDQLSRFQHHLEETYGPAEGQVFDLEAIQRALPDDTALVAWIDLPAAGPKAADPNGEHWAVVLRSRGDPLFQRLRGSGPGGDWTDDDTDLPSRLRSALVQHRGGWQRPARQLAEQRMNPLRRHLAANDSLPAVKHLVALPSTALAGVPLEVLAEDCTISYALSGTLHAHLKTQPAVTSSGLLAVGDPIFDAAVPAKEKPLPPGGLLLTGVQPGSASAQSHLKPDDVLLKYGDRVLTTLKDLQEAIAAAAGKKEVTVELWREGEVLRREVPPGKLGVVIASDPAPKALAERYRFDRLLRSRSGDDGWAALPGTRVEVESLRRFFGGEPTPLLLLDSAASEQKLDALAASGELGKYRYLHLATHGEVDNAFPLRSAVILSRDALPDPQKQLLAGKPVYDGRLTAEQMLRTWNLNADLVTLSACETALGKYERGEGFVGFAQALILCGSRSVCLSLWKVDDTATALLMQRFYANLLGKRDGLKAPLPKAAALREAKEWLRTLPREEALRVAAAVSQGVERGKGRPREKLLPALPEPVPAAKEACPYAHPYYWAAFVLIGDPN